MVQLAYWDRELVQSCPATMGVFRRIRMLLRDGSISQERFEAALPGLAFRYVEARIEREGLAAGVRALSCFKEILDDLPPKMASPLIRELDEFIPRACGYAPVDPSEWQAVHRFFE